MKTRYTIEILASGQPRPYADTIHHARVDFESSGWKPDAPLGPVFVTEDFARNTLLRLPCGFTEVTRKTADHPFATVLDWLRPIDPKPESEVRPNGNPKQSCASAWEFQTSTPFTD